MADCVQSCSSCSCNGTHDAKGISDIEDLAAELARERQKNVEMEQMIKKLQSHALKDQLPKNMPKNLRSKAWFQDTSDPVLTSIYLERYQNYGITRQELMSGRPIIGIAQTGSDLAPCNRHHLQLAQRVREGIRTAGGIAFEFPTHPIQETGKRPTAALDRNLAYLSLVEVLHGYPIDGVVLLTGCDKTTPACIMAAATLDMPALCMDVGPMINGYDGNKLMGSGMVVWKGDQLYAKGAIDFDQLMDMVGSGTPSVGHCNTMGTASTMNAMAEALGMALPGSSAIPAPYKARGYCAYETGLRIVEMVASNRKPSDILTLHAFENAIRVNSAIGGSTNAPIHVNAIAKHIGIDLKVDDWDHIGFHIPLLLDMQPAGRFLGEEFYRAGGTLAIMAELLEAGHLWGDALSCNGRTAAENVKGQFATDRNVIRPFNDPLLTDAGFAHLKGSLFGSAIMKSSTISSDFRKRYLEKPGDENAFEGKVAVFDGPEDYKKRIDDPATPIDEHTILVMRGCGPIGFPGAAETVNMRPPDRLIEAGIESLPCIGDGRQSGTSDSPSILNAAPEAAIGGNLGLLRDGDVVRIDLTKRRADILISDDELKTRRQELEANGGYQYPESQTPWQELYRQETCQLDQGMVLREAVKYQRVLAKHPIPRHQH